MPNNNAIEALNARIKARVERMTRIEAGRAAGVTPSTIQNIVTDRSPQLETLTKIADALGIEYRDLFLDAGEKAVPPGVNVVDTSGWRWVPVIGIAHAGQPLEVWPRDGAETVLAETRDPDAYAVKVAGTSMFPTVQDGDVIVVEPSAEVVEGCIVLAQLENETVVRRYRLLDGKVLLEALNPAAEFKPILISPRQSRGRVFRVTRIVMRKL